ncbi:MAG: SpoIID/LytB domain-containing protein [Thermoleophilia bacterium]|nr:SpoIID/LytB domain-containing protein [Thermoleophilia bacterium]
MHREADMDTFRPRVDDAPWRIRGGVASWVAMLRRPLALALATALLAAGSAAAAPSHARHTHAAICAASCYAAPAGSGALFLFSGHGFGHGVGMSQYGAYGFAQHGWTYDQILAHYYPGTTLGPAPLSTIRVLLADKRKTIAISSKLPFTVVDGAGARHTLAAGKVSLGAGLELAVDGGPARPLPPPLTFSPGDGGTLTLGRAYRGRILVDVVDGKLRAIDIVGLEQYLYGVVPAEMPASWAPAALEAQAVASRSYALATRRIAAPFDVYADARSQVYLGASAEKPSTTAAVDATAGEVLYYNGGVATTYFSSTSGGRTADAADVWGGRSLPYLVSVDDPYDVISPFHDWGPVPVTAQTIAQRLEVPGRIVDAATTPNPSGRVATLDVLSIAKRSAAPTTTSVPGTLASSKLGLRSTWFDVGVLSLSAPAVTAPVPYGTQVTLSGLIRGVDGVVVEQRSFGAGWTDVAAASPDETGAVTLVERPTITTDYRLATARAAAAYVRIRVTPRVQLAAPGSRTALSGTERPALPGAPVQIQQQSTSGSPAWKTIARGTVDASGAFTVPVPLAPGTYRAVVSPGHGYWPGTSAPVTVTG